MTASRHKWLMKTTLMQVRIIGEKSNKEQIQTHK